MNERFVIPARLKSTGMVLMLIGLITLLGGAYYLAGSADRFDRIRFATVLLHNSIFFLLISVASIFIMSAVSLAQGGWIVPYRRVPEAIGANVWFFGILTLIILFCTAFVFRIEGRNPIYEWMTPLANDHIINGKSKFLNWKMFTLFSILTVGFWSYFGMKFRNLSLAQDAAPKNSTKIYWKNFTLAALFLLVYALTQMSTTPWLWIMSIDAHWFSTMFSWYTFASAFVSGMSLIMLWVIYLKNQENLKVVTKDHIHDIAKFQFAFSIFWTYTWFSQFMLIWYGNLPEETTYFKIRMQGPYSLIWFSVFIINFIIPILVLMSRNAKRNYFSVTAMAILIIFGHWLDFYQMIMPGTLGNHFHLGWFEIGTVCGFAGLLIWRISTTLASNSIVPSNNPLLKEAVVHVA